MCCVAAATYVLNALGGLTTYRQAATNAGTVSFPVSVTIPSGVDTVARTLLWLTLALLTLSIAFRAVAVERPPIGNLWEYTVALGWGMVLFTAAFERGFKESAIPAVMLPVAAGMMAIALIFFPSEISPLVPALQANRILGIHVTTMVLAYSALSVSFGASVLYLMQAGADGKRFARLPDAETLEDIGYWSVLVGFPLLGLGPQRNGRPTDVVCLRRLSARARPAGLGGQACRVSAAAGLRGRSLYVLRREFLDLGVTQLRGRLEPGR